MTSYFPELTKWREGKREGGGGGGGYLVRRVRSNAHSSSLVFPWIARQSGQTYFLMLRAVAGEMLMQEQWYHSSQLSQLIMAESASYDCWHTQYRSRSSSSSLPSPSASESLLSSVGLSASSCKITFSIEMIGSLLRWLF